MTMTPEPGDNLDATTTRDRVGMVNGPEDDVTDWSMIDWRMVEDDVRRLRQRIFAASQSGDIKRVRNLQKLMVRSRANALLSVRRVTEINAGRLTADIDRRLVLDPDIAPDLIESRAFPKASRSRSSGRPGARSMQPTEARDIGDVLDDRSVRPQAGACLTASGGYAN